MGRDDRARENSEAVTTGRYIATPRKPQATRSKIEIEMRNSGEQLSYETYIYRGLGVKNTNSRQLVL